MQMRVRLVLTTGVAMLATATLAGAAVDDGGEATDQEPLATGTSAIQPPATVAHIKTLTPAEREANRIASLKRVPTNDPRPHFAALRRPARTGDGLPSDQSVGTAVGAVERDGARLLRNDESGTVRAVPTDRELCVSTTYARGRSTGATDTCVPTAAAVERGAWTVTECSSDERPHLRFLAGAVPDGVEAVRVSRDGSTVAQVNVEDNGFALEVDAPIDAVEMAGSGGDKIALPPTAC